jgi:hypothetical protein
MISGKLSRFVKRNDLATRKLLWSIFKSQAPNARAVYIFGAQRSGTTLLLDCLEKSMEFDVLGESSRAMVNYRIRSDEEIKKIVAGSHHRIAVFKPLTDSHRACEYLSLTPQSKALWAFRRVEDRANSAVAKFGDHNLQILSGFAKGEGFDRWQAQGLSEDSLELLRSFDYSKMTPEIAAAIFWYIRNSLYFELGLDKHDGVLPLAYEDLVRQPGEVMRGVCRFVEADYKDAMVKHVHAKSIGRSESKLPQHIQDLCLPLYERLHKIQKDRWQALTLGA